MIGDDKNSVNRNVEYQLVSDSRGVTNGYVFALPGLHTDGNRYVEEALDRARAIITEDDSIEVPSSVVKVCVKDARKTLARLSNDVLDVLMNPWK